MKNIYTGRTIIDVDKRKGHLFPPMDYCAKCNCYSENQCDKHIVNTHPFFIMDYPDYPPRSYNTEPKKISELLSKLVKEMGITFDWKTMSITIERPNES